MVRMPQHSVIAYLFPGQGSQSVGMGRDLYANFAAARAVFDEADEALGFALSQICLLYTSLTLPSYIQDLLDMRDSVVASVWEARTSLQVMAIRLEPHGIGRSAMTAAGSAGSTTMRGWRGPNGTINLPCAG